MAATTSPMPSWRSTRTASSSRLKVDTIANMGAYLSTFATAVPTYLYATLLAGQYTTPLIYANVRSAFTHTAPVDAYRGAGRPEATFVIETHRQQGGARDEDRSGRDAPAELHPDDAFPYQTPVALQYDSGNYAPILDEAMQDRRLRRLRDAPRRGQVARQAARHRLLVLHRGLRPGAVARWSARSAPASASGSWRRSASTRPAMCRS